MAETLLLLDEAQLDALVAILNGAAHADGILAQRESRAIERVLARVHDGPLPAGLAGRLGQAPAATFDLEAACGALGLTDPGQRITLLKLVAWVTEVDDVIAPAENAYLEQVARFIGAGKHDLADLRSPHGWVTLSGEDI